MSLLYFPSQVSSNSGGGQLVLIKKQTISSDASIEFVDGSSSVVFDSTYNTYIFNFEALHSTSGEQETKMQVTTNGSTWNSVGTTYAHNMAYIYDDTGAANSSVESGAGVTTGAILMGFTGNSMAESSWSGAVTFYNPSSTSLYKNSRLSAVGIADNSPSGHWLQNSRYGGMTWETTSAVTGVKFSVASGNITSGVVTLFGLKNT